MTKRGRAVLRCSKMIRKGVWDNFRVVVSEDKKTDAIAEYERQGCHVIIG